MVVAKLINPDYKLGLASEEVLSANFQQEVTATFLAMRPFFDYMSETLTSDLNGEKLI